MLLLAFVFGAACIFVVCACFLVAWLLACEIDDACSTVYDRSGPGHCGCCSFISRFVFPTGRRIVTSHELKRFRFVFGSVSVRFRFGFGSFLTPASLNEGAYAGGALGGPNPELPPARTGSKRGIRMWVLNVGGTIIHMWDANVGPEHV